MEVKRVLKDNVIFYFDKMYFIKKQISGERSLSSGITDHSKAVVLLWFLLFLCFSVAFFVYTLF